GIEGVERLRDKDELTFRPAEQPGAGQGGVWRIRAEQEADDAFFHLQRSLAQGLGVLAAELQQAEAEQWRAGLEAGAPLRLRQKAAAQQVQGEPGRGERLGQVVLEV